MEIDDNLYHINSLFKQFNIESFDENTSDLMKEFVEKKEVKEEDFKIFLERIKDELGKYEEYYEMLKTYLKIKEESLIKLNSIEETIRKEKKIASEKEYIEKADEQEKEGKEARRRRWIIERTN